MALNKTQLKAEFKKINIPFDENKTKKELNEILEKAKDNLKAFSGEEKSITEKVHDLTTPKEKVAVVVEGNKQASILECLNQLNGKRFDGKEVE